MARPSTLMLLLALAACADRDADLAETAKDRVDPALAMALEDQILVDPTLSQQANEDAIRPPDRPVQVLTPLVQGTMDGRLAFDAAMKQRVATMPGCSPRLARSYRYAARLPAELVLLSTAVVRDSWGSDSPGCSVRVVGFWVPDTLAAAGSRYVALAARAGFKSARSGASIFATRADGARFEVTAQASEGGSAIRLLSKTPN